MYRGFQQKVVTTASFINPLAVTTTQIKLLNSTIQSAQSFCYMEHILLLISDISMKLKHKRK